MKTLITTLSLLIVGLASADIIPPTLNWEAALDTTANNLWESSVNHQANTRFAFVNGVQTPTDVSGTSNLPGVQSAYAMPAAHGDMTSFSTITIPGGGNAAAMDASFEFVFRPVSLSTNYFLFETGGNGAGSGIFIKDSQLVIRAQQAVGDATDAEVTVPLTAGDLNKFHQVVWTMDLDGGSANSLSLYLNGVFIGSDAASSSLTTFAGGDASGIGNLGGGSLTGIDNGVVAGTFDNFDGDIAILRYYQNQILTPAQVQQNFDALMIPEPSSLALVLVGALSVGLLRRRV